MYIHTFAVFDCVVVSMRCDGIYVYSTCMTLDTLTVRSVRGFSTLCNMNCVK